MLDPEENVYMYYHEDISNMKDVSKQKDGINCGVNTLWHLLDQCFKGKEIIDLDSDRFRDQCLLYVTYLCIYETLIKKTSYIFPQLFER